VALLEAVPNFSAGRNQSVVASLAEVAGGGRAHLLHVDSDDVHNRTVVTLAGAPDDVVDALFDAVAAAVQLIDIRDHEGVHPRVGAADVVPLVPLAGTSASDAAELAHSLGARVWSDLRVPVYFYGAASLQDPPLTLARIRSGGIHLDVGDFPHPTAGAVCIGVRPPLIAYNVTLPNATLDDVRKLARAVRASSGGLPGVQALAFELGPGMMQLSMNLVDVDAATPASVLREVGARATASGLSVGGEELVGLCPVAAAPPVAAGRLLEAHIAAAAVEAGARECRARDDEEHQRVAGRLDATATRLRALEPEPGSVLAGAEESAAARRVLRAAGRLPADADEMLLYAARSLRSIVATRPEYEARLSALDAWLDEEPS
jgi:glutamate formiminotransferase/glutamate formiminotransferase/formiminotetrahydrofolate cyclodeaminase